MQKILIFLIIFISFGENKYFKIRDRKFYDPSNAEIAFHGVNLVKKQPPYFYQNFGDQDLRKIKNWGLNAIRIGVMWPGVEPQEGQYNETYLQTMVNLVNKAGKYGIYSLLEFHQDIFSEVFCADGVPAWAVPKQLIENFGRPFANEQPQYQQGSNKPISKFCSKQSWQKWYLTSSVGEAFRRLYTNQNGLLNKFAAYWKKVASSFKNNPYVIGYEIINEPWPGNMYVEPLVMIPGVSQMVHLQSFYDRIAEQIRRVDPQQNICISPVTWSNGVPSGFSRIPGGSQFQNSTMLCFHYYTPPILNMDLFLYARKLDMKRLNIGGLLTQFWGQLQLGYSTMDIIEKCNNVSLGMSWFVWQYGPQFRPWIVKKTYAQRVAGVKQRQYYNNVTKQYILQYKSYMDENSIETNNKIQGKTIIFFNTDHYLYNNNIGKETTMEDGQQIEKLIQNVTVKDLNMVIQIYPKLEYQIVENKYVVIINGAKLGNERVVLVRIRRKILILDQEKEPQKPQKEKKMQRDRKLEMKKKLYRHKIKAFRT